MIRLKTNVGNPGHRLPAALLIALGLHVALILGLTARLDPPRPPRPIIEVTLSRYADRTAPLQADFLAPEHQQGSGRALDRRDPRTRQMPMLAAETLAQNGGASAAPAGAPPTGTAIAPSRNTPSGPSSAAATEAAPSDRLTLDRLTREIANIEARIAAEEEATASRPRVKRLTSVSARSAVEAGYLSAWRQRVERIGNANYPAGNLDGSLRMLVVIDFNGELVDVRLLKSSGHLALDRAALRIVRMAAPFPAFPVDMRRHYDRLEIIRTWQFSHGDARIES